MLDSKAEKEGDTELLTRSMRSARWIIFLMLAVAAIAIWILNDNTGRFPPFSPAPLEIGAVLDSHHGVAVYYNGNDSRKSHGSRNSEEGYYYGKSWQCVEFVKRFYFDAKGHRMPNVWGHARDFFDPSVADGSLNPARGLVQFTNGSSMAPQPDDLVVFRGGSYGHVAIISEVGGDFVELVQQNVGRNARVRRKLEQDRSGAYRITGNHPPAGWLRLPSE